MKIYFTRHGETEWNSRNIISGVTDIDLSEKGKAQADSLAAKIAVSCRDIDKIFCSPLKRAKDTAAPVAQALGIEPVYDERLREWDYGSYEGLSRNADGFAERKLEFGCRMRGGGESVFDIVNRTYGIIDEIRRECAGKNVLLVTHGGICRVIETYFRDMTRKQFSEFFMGNCELKMYETEELK